MDGMFLCVTFPLAPAAALSKGLSHRMVVENKACGPPFQGRFARAEGCPRCGRSGSANNGICSKDAPYMQFGSFGMEPKEPK